MGGTRVLVVAVAVALGGCGGITGRGGPLAGPTPTPSPTPGGPIVFELADRYPHGAGVDVRIRNVGDRAYRYNASGYEACELSYRDETGREFIIPPGTHCDIVITEQIAPGETVTLFTWHLDECLVDQWGCVESDALPPGTYTIEGTFEAAGGGPPAHARATFEIFEVHSEPDVAPNGNDGTSEPPDA